MWPPTSTTLQRLERATSFAAVRDGLARVPDLAIGRARVSDGLVVMTGHGAFGPGGRPANTILVGGYEVVVVDPGDPDEAFLDAVEAEVAARGGRIAAIALTHVDPGHAAGSEELRARTGAPIVVGPGGAAPLSWAVTEIGDGATVGSGDGALTAVATPGHRPDHLAFLAADGTFFAGDALTDRPAVIMPPEGDADQHGATLTRIAGLLAAGTVKRVVPGHGPAVLADPAVAIAAAEAVLGISRRGRWRGSGAG
jgi:glyoxylase-like metal-dependent hydrolase (beta-lactamase superfamily II)